MNIRYKTIAWGGFETGKISYGIQAQKEKGQKFKNTSQEVDGIRRAMIYTSFERAKSIVVALNAGETPEMTEGLVPLKA